MNKKTKRHRVAMFNTLIQEAVIPQYYEEPGAIEDKHVALIEKTRRHTYVVFLNVFLGSVRTALKDMNYECVPNTDKNREEFECISDKTQHYGPFRIYIKLNVSFGPTAADVENRRVDICGVRVNEYGMIAYALDAEVSKLVNRTLNIAMGQLPCVNAKCYYTAPKPCAGTTTCPECKTEQCIECNCEWAAHAGLTCAEYKIASTPGLDDPLINEQLALGGMQPCPKCRVFTIKIEGCLHMRCTSPDCGEHWCWACGIGGLRSDADGVHAHWFDRECPVMTGLFMEDANSAEIVRQAIATRNAKLFGDKLKKVPDEEIKIREIAAPVGQINWQPVQPVERWRNDLGDVVFERQLNQLNWHDLDHIEAAHDEDEDIHDDMPELNIVDDIHDEQPGAGPEVRPNVRRQLFPVGMPEMDDDMPMLVAADAMDEMDDIPAPVRNHEVMPRREQEIAMHAARIRPLRVNVAEDIMNHMNMHLRRAVRDVLVFHGIEPAVGIEPANVNVPDARQAQIDADFALALSLQDEN